MLLVAATLGIPQTVAETIVNIILGASTLTTIIIALTSILAGGISAIITAGGWAAFVNTIKNIAIKQGVRAAVLW